MKKTEKPAVPALSFYISPYVNKTEKED